VGGSTQNAAEEVENDASIEKKKRKRAKCSQKPAPGKCRSIELPKKRGSVLFSGNKGDVGEGIEVRK